MNVWVKRICIFCLIPIILAIILSILLYIPAFQNFAVRQATYYASKSTGMHIGIERIRLSFPIQLNIHGIEVIQDSVPADTLFMLEDLNISIRPIPLLSKELLVESVGLKNLRVNTGNLIDGIEIKGFIGDFLARADRISLATEKGTLNNLALSDATVTVFMTEPTTPPDTTASAPVNWLLKLEKIDLTRVALALQMPGDSLRMSGFITEARLRGGEIDLKNASYLADKFTYVGSALNYDTGEAAPLKGLDPSHIALSDIEIDLSSLLYAGQTVRADINKLVAKERSGLEIKRFEGQIKGNQASLEIPKLVLETLYSEAELKGNIPYAAFAKKPKDRMDVTFWADLGKQDIVTLAGELPEEVIRAYPDTSLRIQAEAKGNLAALELNKLDAQLPGAFSIRTQGKGSSLQSEKQRDGEVELKLFTDNLDFLLDFLPEKSRSNYRIPKRMMLSGNVRLAGQKYAGSLLLREGQGKIQLKSLFDAHENRFKASFEIDSLEPNHFMPNDSLYWMTASIQAEGQGTNAFDSLTWVNLDGKIGDLRYGSSSISDITIKGSLKDNFAILDLNSRYPLAEMDVTLNATLKKNWIQAMLIADMQHLDLYGFHLMDKPFSTSFQLFAEAETDMKDHHQADLTLGNWEIVTETTKVKPKTLILKARTETDSTFVSFHAGDLAIRLQGNKGLNGLSENFGVISKEIDRQMAQDSIVRLALLRPMLPELQLKVTAQKDNPIYNFMNMYSLNFQQLELNMNTSPEKGIQVDGGVYKLLRDTFLLDTIKMRLWQDTVGIFYEAGVVKNKFKKQAPFSAMLSGKLLTGYADALLKFTNEKGKTGILLGGSVQKEDEGGVRLHFFPYEPILAFNPFTLNEDNYILIRNEKDISADFLLKGRQNAFLQIDTHPVDSGLNEIHAALGQVDLHEISKGFSAYMPELEGLLNADFQYMPSDSSYTMTGGISIDSLHYEKKRVGDLLLSAVYLPVSDKEHQVDIHAFRDTEEFMNSFVYYQSGINDSIEGTMQITDLPLVMLNPFIPDDMASLKGKLLGEMNISGTSQAPDIRGFMQLDSASMFVTAANTTLKFDPRQIVVGDNRIHFNKYQILATGQNPFVIDGTVNFSDPSNMIADMTMTAQNMQLLNTKRNKESLVYGKMYVNLNSTIKGPLNSLIMRGDLHLLGGTNVTYVLKDSPLTVQDRLSGLVTFTSFEEDTILGKRPRVSALPLGGMDMLMTIHIDQAVQINADLTPDQSSHVNLEGGGDLSFQYTPMGDMILNGRYTLSSGTIKYSLPVIPLKEFNVQNGSYIQWSGDPMDPSMNITATERIRTSAALDDGSSRMVNFDVGIQLTQRLENLGLKFILDAPEDAAIQEQLARMGEEEKAKQAVSMLVTGMYLAGSSTTGKANLNMGAALNSFLQSEINNIVGSAAKSLDINFGMESYDTNGDGTKRTDYSFRFAKRFYNDRIRIVLGGRISTGEDINQGQAQPFIDNVSIEYRLDPSGTRYVKLFHNKDYESLLEGELTETGAGIVLHKKMQYMRELFIFKRNKTKPQKEENNKEKTEEDEN